jgi:hypothetical protein
MCIDSVIQKLKTALKQPAFWLLVVLITVPASMTLTGRFSSLPHNDLVQDTTNAYNFVHHGEFPKHSGISTYFGMIPPGISYAFVPGMIVFGDNPTAAERFGAALMFAGTLVGLYLWLNSRLGFWPTALSMLIFTAGRSGVFYLFSLWPRGHVFFVVWFLYFLTLWVERRKSFWLGAALVVFAASTYWFMELVPLFIVLPVLYFLYKPPVGWKAITAAVALSVLIWLPYLSFEYPRGFIDLRALVTQKILVKQYALPDVVSDKSHRIVNSWEVPKLKEEAAKNGGKLPAPDKAFWLNTSAWGNVWAETETRYYLNEPGFVFFYPKLNEWCFQSFTTGRFLRQNRTAWEPGVYKVDFPKEKMNLPEVAAKPDLTPATRLKTLSPFYNFGGEQALGLFVWHVLLFFFAAVYAARKGVSTREIKDALRSWTGWILRRRERTPLPSPDGRRLVWTVIIVALILPLVVQCILVKSWSGLMTSERRFVWLWLAEAVTIGAALGSVKVRGWRIGIPLGLVALITFAINPGVASVLNNSYSSIPGRYRSGEDKALDALAARIKETGRTSVKIGYDLNQNEWMCFVRPIDGVSKCAIDWDVVLLLRHGITNLDTTVEGLSADDEYRVYDPNYNVPHDTYWRSRWSMSYDGSLPEMTKVAEAGGYEILQAKKP